MLTSGLTYLAIFAVSSIAAFVGTNVGGAGLLIIPAVMLLGAPSMKVAIASAELGCMGMMIAGGLRFHQHDKIDYPIAIPATLISMAGAIVGAMLLVCTAPPFLQKLAGFSFIAMLVLLLRRNAGLPKETNRSPKLVNKVFGGFAFFLNGMWTGFFSAGAHVFASYVLVCAYGRTFLESAGILKVQGLGVGVVSVAIFFWYGLIDWKIAGMIFLGSAWGAEIGSKYALQKGDLWVKRLFSVVVVVTSLALIF